MSIIHDALKKTQQGLASQNSSERLYEDPPEVLQSAGQEKSKSETIALQNNFSPLFAIICSLAITIASAWYIIQYFHNQLPDFKIVDRKPFYQLINTIRMPSLTAQAPENVDPLNIQGVMSNTSGNLVLINGQVYQTGDTVDGAKITKINLDSIIVMTNGTEKTIHVKN